MHGHMDVKYIYILQYTKFALSDSGIYSTRYTRLMSIKTHTLDL